MSKEKTMRSLSNCKQMAEQLNVAFNGTLENIRVSAFNMQIKVSNLQQSEQDKAVLTELQKYLLSSVYEPLAKNTDAIQEFASSIDKAQAAADDGAVSSSLKTLIGFAKRLMSEIKLVKTQAKRLYVNFSIQNACICEQMSDDQERIGDIEKSLDSITDIIRKTVSTIESVLNYI